VCLLGKGLPLAYGLCLFCPANFPVRVGGGIISERRAAHHRVEMHLVAETHQKVHGAGRVIEFSLRREHSQREQLQVHYRTLWRADAGLRLEGYVDLNRRGSEFLRGTGRRLWAGARDTRLMRSRVRSR
jgi:hypothetical protein